MNGTRTRRKAVSHIGIFKCLSSTVPVWSMKMIVNALCHCDTDSVDACQFLDTGAGNLSGATKGLQQALAPFRPQAFNGFQCRATPLLAPLASVCGECKAVGLVPDLLHQMQGR